MICGFAGRGFLPPCALTLRACGATFLNRAVKEVIVMARWHPPGQVRTFDCVWSSSIMTPHSGHVRWLGSGRLLAFACSHRSFHSTIMQCAHVGKSNDFLPGRGLPSREAFVISYAFLKSP